MPKRPPKPVESFGPELFQALVDGSKREIILKLPYDQAVRFRLRINQLREAMRQVEHPKYLAVSQARITIKWPPDTATRKYPGGNLWPVNKKVLCDVIVSPNDFEFRSALQSAGVTIQDTPSTIPQAEEVKEEQDILAEFLRKEN